MKKRLVAGLLVGLLASALPLRAWADGTDKLLDLLVRKGVITQDEGQVLREELAKEVEQAAARMVASKEAKPMESGAPSRSGGVEVGYKDNFYLRTSDGNFEIKAAGRVHTDLRVFESSTKQIFRRDSLDPRESLDSGFQIRRARLGLSGTLWKNYELKVETNLNGGGAALTDGYLNLKHLPWAQLRVGQFKEPFGLENMSSTNYIDFIERSMAATNTGAPLRDIGIMVYGKPWAGQVEYGLGVFNGEGIELALRYEELRVDAGSRLSGGNLVDQNQASALTVGLNWYLNPHVRWSTNYIFEKFERGSQSPHQGHSNHNVFLGRLQGEY